MPVSAGDRWLRVAERSSVTDPPPRLTKLPIFMNDRRAGSLAVTGLQFVGFRSLRAQRFADSATVASVEGAAGDRHIVAFEHVDDFGRCVLLGPPHIESPRFRKPTDHPNSRNWCSLPSPSLGCNLDLARYDWLLLLTISTTETARRP